MEGSAKRVLWIDAAKGILIFSVVLGHAIQEYELDLTFLYKFIYSFHMPAFFVLSGYLFKLKSEEISFISYAQKKVSKLLLPYVFFCALIFLCHMAKSILLHSDMEFFEYFTHPDTLIRTLLMCSNSAFSNLWFLPCMLVSSCLMFLIWKYVHSEKTRDIICILMGTAAFAYGRFCAVSLPLCIETSFLGVFYMWAGRRLNDCEIIDNIKKGKKAGTGFVIILLINTYMYFCGFSEPDTFYNLQFSSIVLHVITSFFGTLTVIGISMPLCALKILNNIGKNSLYIYGLHFIIQNFIGFVVPPISYGPVVRVLLAVVIAAVNIMICHGLTEGFYRIKDKLKLTTRRG